MARIQEYNSDVQAQGSLQTDRATANGLSGGNGISDLGEGLGVATKVVARKVNQDDISSTAAAMSKANADYTTYIQDQTQRGTLDPEDVMKKAEEHFGQISDNISTSAGRDYFTKVSAKMLSSLQMAAHTNRASLDGHEAIQKHTETLNAMSSTLINNPEAGPVTLEAHNEYINDMVAHGGLPAEAGMKLKTQGNAEMGTSMAMGYINQNPQEALGRIKGGQFDTLIDGTQKETLISRAEQQIRMREADSKKRKSDADDALKQKQEADMKGALPDLISGNLRAQDIPTKFPDLSFAQQEHLVLSIQKDAKAANATSPAVYNQMYSSIIKGEITDTTQVLSRIGPGGIDAASAIKLNKLLSDNGTPEGKQEAAEKKQFMAMARALLVKPGPFGADPDGEERLLATLQEFDETYRKRKNDDKISPHELVSGDGPNSLKYIILKNRPTADEVLDTRVKRISEQRDATTTTPTPAPQGAGGAPNPNARLPNESPSAWKARTKNGTL